MLAPSASVRQMWLIARFASQSVSASTYSTCRPSGESCGLLRRGTLEQIDQRHGPLCLSLRRGAEHQESHRQRP